MYIVGPAAFARHHHDLGTAFVAGNFAGTGRAVPLEILGVLGRGNVVSDFGVTKPGHFRVGIRVRVKGEFEVGQLTFFFRSLANLEARLISKV